MSYENSKSPRTETHYHDRVGSPIGGSAVGGGAAATPTAIPTIPPTTDARMVSTMSIASSAGAAAPARNALANSPFDALGEELIDLIAKYVPAEDLLALRAVCKKFNRISTPVLFRRLEPSMMLDTQPFNENRFFSVIRELREHQPDLHRAVIHRYPARRNEFQHYTLEFARQVLAFLRTEIDTPEKRSAYVTKKTSAVQLHHHVRNSLTCMAACLALFEGLITPEQAAVHPQLSFVQYLFCYLPENGLRNNHHLTALREGLITPDQVAAMPGGGYVINLLSNNGLTALREGLITPDQVAAMPGFGYVLNLLCNNGLTALREGLITPESARLMTLEELSNVIYPPR